MKQLNETDSTDYMAAAGCFCLASRQAARKITRLYDPYMQEAGIRVTQFTILSQLMLRVNCRSASWPAFSAWSAPR